LSYTITNVKLRWHSISITSLLAYLLLNYALLHETTRFERVISFTSLTRHFTWNVKFLTFSNQTITTAVTPHTNFIWKCVTALFKSYLCIIVS